MLRACISVSHLAYLPIATAPCIRRVVSQRGTGFVRWACTLGYRSCPQGRTTVYYPGIQVWVHRSTITFNRPGRLSSTLNIPSLATAHRLTNAALLRFATLFTSAEIHLADIIVGGWFRASLRSLWLEGAGDVAWRLVVCDYRDDGETGMSTYVIWVDGFTCFAMRFCFSLCFRRV